ncbi:MAG: L,D-transpeptidase [Beijerinckiaceae bacterium]|nr:L,D-transpeptidase [Beijerinckiaceae bacterium]
MKHRALLTSAALGALLTAAPAGAQTIYPQAGLDNHAQPERTQVSAGYGGGFIEMLMTGQEPGRQPRPSYRADPYPTARPGQRVDLTYDPASEDHSLGRPARANPGTPGGNGAVYPYQRYRRLASYAPVDTREVPDLYRKQVVDYDGGQSPGTIVIDTPNKFLFLVQGNGKALRYGIGVGRPGFEWAGVKTVSRKAEWPGWTPPPEMLKRRPDLPRHMAGGPENPLGARAMYLGSSLYRIHGTNEPGTIGQSVSSGCIRMTNDDVVDLYDRVKVGAKVIVR